MVTPKICPAALPLAPAGWRGNSPCFWRCSQSRGASDSSRNPNPAPGPGARPTAQPLLGGQSAPPEIRPWGCEDNLGVPFGARPASPRGQKSTPAGSEGAGGGSSRSFAVFFRAGRESSTCVLRLQRAGRCPELGKAPARTAPLAFSGCILEAIVVLPQASALSLIPLLFRSQKALEVQGFGHFGSAGRWGVAFPVWLPGTFPRCCRGSHTAALGPGCSATGAPVHVSAKHADCTPPGEPLDVSVD